MKSKRTWKFIGWTIAIAIALFALARVYYALTDDFRLANISFPLPKEEHWTIPSPSNAQEEQLQKILSQPFNYMGKGAQSYAFVSEDGRFVLKFFKFKHLHPSIFVELLPPVGFLKTYKDKQSARKERKLFGVFNSYKLAYDVDKEESGLIFIQLNTVDNPKRTVTVIDKIGIVRTVDLQEVPFILQDRGTTLRAVLTDLLNKHQVETAKQRIGQIFDLYADEYSKGIYDHDHGVMQNTGFVGHRPIHLDVGKLLRDDKMRDKKYAKQDALIVASKIKHWIKGHFPNDYQELSRYINNKVNELF